MKALPKVKLPRPEKASLAEDRLIGANEATLNDCLLRLVNAITELEERIKVLEDSNV